MKKPITEADRKKSTSWTLKDVFAMSVRPLRVTAAYAGLNTQMSADPEMRNETDHKWHGFMENNKAQDGSIRKRAEDFVAKPISVAKESYNDALDDLHDGKYLSAAKGLVVSSFMGATLKAAGVAAMTGVGKAAAVYGTASVATNAVYDRVFAKDKLKQERIRPSKDFIGPMQPKIS